MELIDLFDVLTAHEALPDNARAALATERPEAYDPPALRRAAEFLTLVGDRAEPPLARQARARCRLIRLHLAHRERVRR